MPFTNSFLRVTITINTIIKHGKMISIVKYRLLLLLICAPALSLSQQLPTGSTANLWQIQFARDVLMAFGQGGIILHSPDGGTTWEQRSSGVGKVLTSASFPTEKTGYAVNPEGIIIKTTDGGTSWTPLPYTGGDVLLVTVFPTESTGFIGTDNGKILKTTDGGETWQTVYQHADHFFRGLHFLNETIGFALGGGGNASNGYGILLRTTNGGQSWEMVNPPLRSTLNSLFMTTPLTGFAVGYDGHILKTRDGGVHWEVSAIAGVRSFRAVSFANENSGIAVGDAGMAYETNDAGASWVRLDLGVTSDLNAICLHKAAFFIAGMNGVVIRKVLR